MLRIPAAVVSLNSEDALAEASIRIRRSVALTVGPFERHEGRIDVVERLLPEGLNEGKQRRGERRRDAGLLDPGEPVPGAEHEGVGQPEGEADSGSKVRLLQIAAAAREAVLPEEVELLGLKVEDGAAIVGDGGREVEGVANTEVQREPLRGPPSRPEERTRRSVARGSRNFRLDVDGEARDLVRAGTMRSYCRCWRPALRPR